MTLWGDQALRIIEAESGITKRIVCDPNVIREGLHITAREKRTRSGANDLYGIDPDYPPTPLKIKMGWAHRHPQHYNSEPMPSNADIPT